MTIRDWQEVVAEKRAEVASKLPQEWKLPSTILEDVSPNSNINVVDIPRTCGLLSDKELDITEKYDGVALLEKMASKELSSSEVTLAFCKRAAIAHQVTNCLTEMFFDVAVERAQYLDDYLSKEGKPLSQINKDSFKIKGISSTIGYVSFIAHGPATSNSALVDILLSLGAVLYVKTNIPQTLMTADSDNNVFGKVMNPNKLSLTAGGSSGGEGALVAMRGSVIGVGTDIAGSIRIPALCCGTLGFKPTTNRIPYGGQAAPSKAGSPGIVACAGPLTNSPRDARLFLENVINSKPWDLDYAVVAFHWQVVPPKKPLNIGIIFQDPSIPVMPPLLRAIRSAAEKLTAAGHAVTTLTYFPSFKEISDLSWSYFDLDNEGTGFKHIHASGEPMVTSVEMLYSPPPEGRRVRVLEEVFEMNQKRNQAKADWNKIFVDGKFDILIAPGNASTALPHDTYGQAPYTVMWNLVDYPACVIPYLRADKSIDVASSDLPTYDPEAIHGAPCSIQIVGRHMQDEALMNAVEIVAGVLDA
ncbi:general amidase, putative [Paecilomyces variotii No. 5]|uniref:amidase n=1 Tax=Byssochlamys spectabilis (strain No. 5 / NBRC 109023) TaxID=1356009 RepID=V5FWJ4_BYSSN|nr:general amidase, putative [Paecilomyces variotii No. 5]